MNENKLGRKNKEKDEWSKEEEEKGGRKEERRETERTPA